MYVAVAALSVPEENREAYEKAAAFMADWSMDHGAIEVMEAWELDVPNGKTTDFRKAVKAPEGEKIVTGWVIWPDKATFDKANEAMMRGEGFENHEAGDMPFDGSRLIYGGFEPILTRGRKDHG
ncbi:DUF1428 domain-containing protein [Erythrobacter sp. THAF29]|uniref:DUF1428 domain-containing protein n=1 Tax=Erythrobacter sp. THAF29 TaxID=2587851 RepID=UPI0012688C26|nr:DUF1428 domain-containing protein [Erythrobacter sp. THAF29]QFT77239.1 hypothetical protein FIU90_06765 [Erythrobacter sp. THAF29]